jgi:hypothetical protein
MSAPAILAVALSYIGILAIQYTVTKCAVAKAHKAGFLNGYRRCATARRTIVRPPTTNQHQAYYEKHQH